MKKITSSFIVVIILGLIILGGFYFFNKNPRDIPAEILPILIEEENDQYSISISVNRTGINSIDRALEGFIENKVADLKSIAQEIREDSEFSFIAGLGMKDSIFQYQDLKSLVLEIYDYAGGAHGNVYYKTWVFNQEGDIFSLSDLFDQDINFLDHIFLLVKDELINKLQSPPDEDWLDRGTGKTAEENYKHFALDEKNLIFFFPPYQVAAYAEGPKIVKIPLLDLKDILKDKF